MRERKCGFQVPGEVAEDIVGELGSEYGECRVLFFCLVPPAAREFVFLL
jgi:hypothetical protein